jgi:hypothetical protein
VLCIYISWSADLVYVSLLCGGLSLPQCTIVVVARVSLLVGPSPACLCHFSPRPLAHHAFTHSFCCAGVWPLACLGSRQINLILLYTIIIDVVWLTAQARSNGWLYAPSLSNMSFGFSIVNVVAKVFSAFPDRERETETAYSCRDFVLESVKSEGHGSMLIEFNPFLILSHTNTHTHTHTHTHNIHTSNQTTKHL